MALFYLDVIVVLLLAAPIMAAGAPVLGYAVGAVAWTAGRLASTVAEKRIAAMEDLRRQIGWGIASSMGRVWILACTIVAVGIAGEREDALTTALVIFGAFSVYFVRSALAHLTQKRSPGR